VAVRAWPVSRLVSVTFTFAITAPDWSVIVPVIAPVDAVCPTNDGGIIDTSPQISNAHSKF